MQALGGTLGERAARALAAGCDIALHCNGRMDEMVRGRGQDRADDRGGRRRFEAGRRYLARHCSLGRRRADAGQKARSAPAGMGIRQPGQIQWREADPLD